MDMLQVFSPYDNHLIREIPYSTQAEMEQALQAAHTCFLDRKNRLKPHQRIAILEKTLALVQKNKELFAKQAAEEGGKPLIDSRIEVERAIQGIKLAIEHIGHTTGKEIAMGLTPSSDQRLAFTRREPVGVVLAISAFNHPFNLIVHQVIPAIAVGCPVIVKPATTTPLSCLNLVNCLYEAGLPKKWCQVIIADGKDTEPLVRDPRISFLSFIGSSKVGWYLRSILPPGAHCALEHGGAAPVIIEPDANMQDMLPLLAKGGFYHAGQVCVSVQRVLAHENICDEVLAGLTQRAKNLVVGDPVSEKTDVGPLIQAAEVTRVAEWVDEAKAKGATILCGGEKISDTCYKPTVVLNPPQDTRLANLEIFGPVITVQTYQQFSDAVTEANRLAFAFQSAIFTKNIDRAMAAFQQLEANAVLINDHTAFRVDWMPFGGRKESGLGFGGIPYSMHDMTFEKMAVIRSDSL